MVISPDLIEPADECNEFALPPIFVLATASMTPSTSVPKIVYFAQWSSQSSFETEVPVRF